MSVASKNPFDLLGDDSEPSPAPAKAAAPKAAVAPASQQPKVVPGAQPRTGNQRGGRGGPRRGGARNGGERNGESALPGPEGVAQGMENAGGFDGERVPPPRKAHHGPDAHTKGPRGNRPDRGGNRRPRGGGVPADGGERRHYERRTGAHEDSQKKIEHGWGADEGQAELTAEVQGETDAQAEGTQTPAEGDGGWGVETPAAGDAPAATEDAAPVEPEEPEEVTKSYDEYLAEKAAQSLGEGLGKKEARKVEGESLEGKAFRREAINDFFGGKEEKTSAAKTKAAKKEKVFIDFEGRFAPPARAPREGDRAERGGAGRGRGGGRGRGAERGSTRGRGGARGGRSAGPAPVDASDEKAFPALGA